MIHLGDITKISGYDAPPVDVVIGGSPCQDLSVAGKRAGLAGERSGLFMEQIRIIKEMRDADIHRGRTGQFIRPRFMVFENVIGAFSSNRGEDFRVVLEETIRIADQNAPDVPLPPKGKWPLADCWMGDGWSVAYRVLDAQFWGVPQRRRRIALVADFGGHAAPEILFVRESNDWYSEAGGTPGEETAAGTGSGTGEAIPINTMIAVRHKRLGRGTGLGVGEPGDPEFTISTNHSHAVFQPGIICAGFKHKAGAAAGSIGFQEEIAPTLSAEQMSAVYVHQNQLGEVRMGLVAGTLNTNSNASGRNAPLVFDARGNGDGADQTISFQERAGTPGGGKGILIQKGRTGALSTLNNQYVFDAKEIVRRLTPLECERLQGYPDGWTDIGPWTDSAGKLHKESSDSARYKALGNSIALPPWSWVLKRLCACYERTATMASLFDGIGGFPLIWERLNGPGSCLWGSEVEEFCIAVTKRHFTWEETS